MSSLTKTSGGILLLYGYHLGTTGSFLERSLRKKVPVFAVGPGHPPGPDRMPCDTTTSLLEILERIAPRFQPERVLVLESGVKFFPGDLEASPLPVCYYAFDPHFNGFWQVEYAKLFARVWITFPQFLSKFRHTGHPEIHCLPHGYDHEIYRDHQLPRTWDVAFVGDLDPINRPERVRLLLAIRDAGFHTMITKGIWNEEVARLYSQSRLVFNHNHDRVLNPRNFEAAACGAVLLANPADGLTDCFVPDQEILIYQDAPDLVAKARELLGDSTRWQQMAEAGRAAAWHHRWDARVDQLLDWIGKESLPTPFDRWERIKAHAYVCLHRGLPGRTVVLLEQLEGEGDTDPEVPLLKGWAYLRHGFHREAAEAFKNLLRLEPPPLRMVLEQVSNTMAKLFQQLEDDEGTTMLRQRDLL